MKKIKKITKIKEQPNLHKSREAKRGKASGDFDYSWSAACKNVLIWLFLDFGEHKYQAIKSSKWWGKSTMQGWTWFPSASSKQHLKI